MKDSDRLAPTTRFECGSPRITAIQCPQMRDFCVPAECVRQDVRDGHFARRGERFDFERMECPACGERFVPVPSQPGF